MKALISKIFITAIAFTAILVSQANAQFGTMPGTKCCITRVEKALEGFRSAAYLSELACGTQKENIGTAKYQLTFGANLQCNEATDLVAGSVLKAEGNFIQRQTDGFATFAGKFTITSPTGAILYSGLIEINERTPCTSKATGWIEGKNNAGVTLRGNLQLEILTTTPLATKDTKLRGSLYGVEIKCQ